MNLESWNSLLPGEAVEPVLACCGSRTFAERLVDCRPFTDLDSLLTAADEVWWALGEDDWREAFACHPRIGERPGQQGPQFSEWSRQEQTQVQAATGGVLQVIAEKNREYEALHGLTYIVCANGRSAEELLAILDRRMSNSTAAEIREAAEQQRQITNLRFRKWLQS